MDEVYELGATIKNLRVTHKMTQKALGNILGVSEATVSKYESNLAIPPFEVLRTIAVTFNISMDILCGISHKGSVSVHGLSESQIDIVKDLTDAFRIQNMVLSKKLTEKQYEQLGQIVVELSK